VPRNRFLHGRSPHALLNAHALLSSPERGHVDKCVIRPNRVEIRDGEKGSGIDGLSVSSRKSDDCSIRGLSLPKGRSVHCSQRVARTCPFSQPRRNRAPMSVTVPALWRRAKCLRVKLAFLRQDDFFIRDTGTNGPDDDVNSYIRIDHCFPVLHARHGLVIAAGTKCFLCHGRCIQRGVGVTPACSTSAAAHVHR